MNNYKNEINEYIKAASDMIEDAAKRSKRCIKAAKDEIIDIIKDSKDGSSFTLLCVSDESIISFQNITDKKNSKDFLSYYEKQEKKLIKGFEKLYEAFEN